MKFFLQVKERYALVSDLLTLYLKDVLVKANLSYLNEAVAAITATTVWKSKKSMNPLGQCLFHERLSLKFTRSTTSKEIPLHVPGYSLLATNTMVRVWSNIPELQNAVTLGEARSI